MEKQIYSSARKAGSAPLLSLLRISFGEDPAGHDFASLGREEWRETIECSFEQGVSALAVDGYNRWVSETPEQPGGNQTNPGAPDSCALETDPALRELKLQWLGGLLQAEAKYARQWKAARAMGEIFASEGIRTRVMKGFSLAALYPEPSHRECCDCDVFLGSDYEAGNLLIEREGVHVDRDYYKNSTFYYKGLMVENHCFCSPVRGFRRRKAYERYLRSIIDEGAAPLGDSKLWRPGALFTALFVTSHAQLHFLVEGGINLRHVCDFALALRELGTPEQWQEYERRCREFGLWKFAGAMGSVAHEVCGVQLPLSCPKKMASERLLKEIFVCNHVAGRSGAKSKTESRLEVVRAVIRGRWKFPLYSDRSALSTLLETGLAFVFERKVRISS